MPVIGEQILVGDTVVCIALENGPVRDHLSYRQQYTVSSVSLNGRGLTLKEIDGMVMFPSRCFGLVGDSIEERVAQKYADIENETIKANKVAKAMKTIQEQVATASKAADNSLVDEVAHTKTRVFKLESGMLPFAEGLASLDKQVQKMAELITALQVMNESLNKDNRHLYDTIYALEERVDRRWWHRFTRNFW